MSEVKTAKGFWPGFNQRKFLDDWVMLLAALGIFVLSAVFIDNFLTPLNMIKVPVTKRALVIGGGVAGIIAALDLAEQYIPVTLVEKEPTIGGVMAQLNKTFPTMDCSI